MALNPKAIHTKNGDMLAVESNIEVVKREKARFTVALGWNYRFQSGGDWVLVPLEEAAFFIFEDKPEGQASR